MTDRDVGEENVGSDQWTWSSALNKLWWAFMGCIMLAVIVGVLLPTGRPEHACPEVTHIKIAVGSTVFSVPRTYDLHVSGKNIPNNFNEKRYCPKHSNDVLNADGLTFLSAHTYSSDDYKSVSIAGVQISVGNRKQSYRKPEDRFDFYAGQLKKEGLDLATLKQKHGFRAHEVEIGTNIYFALDDAEAFETVPLTITCGSPALVLHGKNIGRTCSTGYYALSENLVVSYRFRDGAQGIETWTNLNKRVREFVRSFEVSGTQN